MLHCGWRNTWSVNGEDKWTDEYVFILPENSAKPVRLECCETVALIKSGNVKRHNETKHGSVEEIYQQKSEMRPSVLVLFSFLCNVGLILCILFIYLFSYLVSI